VSIGAGKKAVGVKYKELYEVESLSKAKYVFGKDRKDSVEGISKEEKLRVLSLVSNVSCIVRSDDSINQDSW